MCREKLNAMPEFWIVFFGVIALVIACFVILSKLKARAKRQRREQHVPFVQDNIQAGVSYNVFMKNGLKFQAVHIVGTTDVNRGEFSLGGWEDMLILRKADGKRIFVRLYSVRCLEEV